MNPISKFIYENMHEYSVDYKKVLKDDCIFQKITSYPIKFWHSYCMTSVPSDDTMLTSGEALKFIMFAHA